MEDFLDTDDTDEGNTKPHLRSRGWFFTLNNPQNWHTNHENFIEVLECSDVFKYIFQLEEGENKTPHFQGVVYYENARSFASMKELHTKVNWRKCKDWKAANKYCCKPEGRLEGPWAKGIKIPKEVGIIKELQPWMADCLSILTGPVDNRAIYWYVDYPGGAGKTSFAKWLCVKKGALYVSGKAADIKFAISKWLESGKEIDIVIFDIPRCNLDYVNYQALEEIKNGIFFSGKYESGMAVFAQPHVICFANERPKVNLLSKDRWRIIELNSDPKIMPDDYL